MCGWQARLQGEVMWCDTIGHIPTKQVWAFSKLILSFLRYEDIQLGALITV